LDGTNYHDWKFAVSLLMRRAGVWKIIEDVSLKKEDGYSKLSEEALTIIGLTIDTSQYVLVRDIKDGPAAWQALAGVYEKPSRANRIALKRSLYNYQPKEDETAQDYASNIVNWSNKLRNIGAEISESELADILLMNADPVKYRHIVASLSAIEGELTSRKVIGALMDEESRLTGGERIVGNVGYKAEHRTMQAKSDNGGTRRRIAIYATHRITLLTAVQTVGPLQSSKRN